MDGRIIILAVVAISGCATPERSEPLPAATPEPEPPVTAAEEPLETTYRVEPFLLSFADVRENYNRTVAQVNEGSNWFMFDLPMPDLAFSKSREKIFIHNDHGEVFQRLAVAISRDGRSYYFHAREVDDPSEPIQIGREGFEDLEGQLFDRNFEEVHFVEIWIPDKAVSRWSDSIEHIKVIRSVPHGPTVIGGQTNMEAISQRQLFR
jgi:hypothetical protein